jgi:benzoyl-CoA reductase/2-hydroxyglutaryl-CoA dehydratase subunit BcrC/BadD/HgdB
LRRTETNATAAQAEEKAMNEFLLIAVAASGICVGLLICWYVGERLPPQKSMSFALDVGPNDTLVVLADGNISEEVTSSIRESLEHYIADPSRKAIVMGGGLRLGVIHRNARKAVNRCYETMTRVCVGVYTVRVWTETRYQKFGPNEEVVNAMYLLSQHDVTPGSISSVIDGLEDISAYEILDKDGNGSVTYPNWG